MRDIRLHVVGQKK